MRTCCLIAVSVACCVPVALGQYIDREHCFDGGLDVSYVSYEEKNFMKESGGLWGLYGRYTRYWNDVVALRGFASYVWGDLKYEGGLQDQNGNIVQEISHDTPNKIISLRGTAGYRFSDVDVAEVSLDLTPYAGLGWRYLVDDLPGEGGYKREQTYVYFPIGLLATTEVFGDWIVECRVEFDFLIRGRNESHPQGGTLRFSQKSGTGFGMAARFLSPEVDLPVVDRGAAFSLEPFLQTWTIDKSNVLADHLEPKNKSWMVGVRGGVDF